MVFGQRGSLLNSFCALIDLIPDRRLPISLNQEQYPTPSELMADARSKFPTFYLLAEPVEETALDSLVMANAGLGLTVNTVRPKFDLETRDRLEKATDGAEKLFMQLVDTVRLCPVLSRIPDDERALMEETLFRVRMPGD